MGLVLGILVSTKEFHKIAGTKYEEQGVDWVQLRDMLLLAVRMRTLKPIPVSFRVDGVERLTKSAKLLRVASRPHCQPRGARVSLGDECGRTHHGDMSKSLEESYKHNWVKQISVPDKHVAESIAYPSFLGCACFLPLLRFLIPDA